MKKIIYAFSALALVFALAVFLVLNNLPSFASYAISKLIGSEVLLGRATLAYRANTIVMDFGDVQVKGGVGGQAKALQLVLGTDRGLYLKQATVSGFELSLPAGLSFPAEKGGIALFAVPREIFEMKKGVITYGKEKFIVDELKLSNLKSQKPFAFELVVQNDKLFGKLTASGEGGIYKGMATDVKGRLAVTSLNLNELSDVMGGRTSTNGSFTYEKKRFVFQGPFELSDYSLKDPIFRGPFSVAKAEGRFSYMYFNNIMDIKIRGGKFRGTPLTLDLIFKNNRLSTLELASGLLEIGDVKEVINLDRLAETDFKIWNYMDSGKVKVRKFLYRAKNPPFADLEIVNTTISHENILFTDVAGMLSFDDKELRFSGAGGKLKSSIISGVEGVIPFKKGKDISAKGNYIFNLEELPSILDVGEVNFRKGETEGAISVEGNAGRGYTFQGKGRLNDAQVIWKEQPVSVKGAYSFNNNGIAFDPLLISRDATHMAVTGDWNEKGMDIRVRGVLDVDHLKPFIAIPFYASGIAGLDLRVQKDAGFVKTDGDISMDDLFLEIPAIIRKNKGVESKVSLSVQRGEDGIHIDRLLYNLDVIKVKAKGDVKPDNTINLDLAVDVSGLERIAGLFFFEGNRTKGDLELSLSIRDLLFPIKKLPYITGYAKINNGFLRLPFMAKPFQEIDLVSDFKGETFNITVNRLKCGGTLLKNGTIHSEGLEAPRVSLYADMETFDLEDFRTPGEFIIRPIDTAGLMARVSGDMFLRAKSFRAGSLMGEHLDIKGLFSDRRLNISELRVNAFEGSMDGHGSIDLSGSRPRVYASGRLNRVRSGLLMQAFGAETYLVDGRSSIYGQVDSTGNTMKELVEDISGNFALYSRNGVIRKWNLLSKIFGLLNVYDSLRGKAALDKEGLPYTRMGATFTANEGIFTTKDFLIDSPSMVIAGEGALDIKRNRLDGSVAVSPLVTLDRTIDKIPILRNILIDKGKGFLYAAYKVSGHIDDPDISASVVKSIGGKTIEILRNILVLPREMLEGIQEK